MSRDDLIEMARLAGCGWAANGTKPMLLGEKQLERFAALVAAHEREQLRYDHETEIERLTSERDAFAEMAERLTADLEALRARVFVRR